MKLTDVLKAAAAGLVAANLSAQEAKADGWEDLQRGLDIINQLQNGSGGSLRFDPYQGQSGRNRSCHQDWYLPNGNRGGTYDPCNGERMPRGGRSEPSQKQQMQQSLQYCYTNLPDGRTATGYAKNCGGNYKKWQQLQVN